MLGEAIEFVRVSLGQRHIQVHAGREPALAGMQRDADRQAAARDVAVNHIADLGFEHLHLTRKIYRDLALLPVHGAQFDCDLETVLGTISAPISRH